MFRIFTNRDLMNEDPAKRNKIKGFIVEYGYRCYNSSWCPCGHTCKYRYSFKWYNFAVNVSRFFEQLFHIKFNLPIYFQKHSTDLSGTPKCPHQIPKIYTCLDCQYSSGYNNCNSEIRHKMIKDGRFSEINYPIEDYIHSRRCKLFCPNNLCQDYAKLMDEYIMNLMYITTRRDDNANS